MVDIDAVIHLVGIIAPTRTWTFERVHVGITGALCRAAREAGVRRFLHMSALGTRPGALTAYHRTKWAAEEIVRQSGLDFTMFRPSIIYGPADQFVNRFVQISRWSPVLPVMGSGRGRLQPVAVEEVAHCFVSSLSEPASIGQTYDLCGPRAYSLDELLDIILSVTRRRRFKLRVPGAVAGVMAKAAELVCERFLNRPAPLTTGQLVMLEELNTGDPRPASARFGYEPLDFREGIARYLAGSTPVTSQADAR
jgi:NADH dehydrogenase